MSADFIDLFCTDEDIAVYCPGDILALLPPDQRLADSKTGVFDSADLWSLTDAASGADFSASGIVSGHLCVLVNKARRNNDLLIVDSAASGSLRLRRKGLASAEGLTPGPPGGATGVDYYVPYLRPQIAEITRRLRERFRFIADTQFRLSDMREPAVLWTVFDLYQSAARGSSGTKSQQGSDFARKTSETEARLVRSLRVLDRTYGIAVQGRRAMVGQIGDADGLRVPVTRPQGLY